MRFQLIVSFSTALLVVASSLAVGAEPPADLEQVREQLRRNRQEQVAALPELGRFSIGQVVYLAVEDEELVVRTSLHEVPRNATLQIEELPGFAQVLIQDRQADADPALALRYNLLYDDFDNPGAVHIHTAVLAIPTNVQVVRAWQTVTSEHFQVELIQVRAMGEHDADRVTLRIQARDANGQPLIDKTLEAPSLPELSYRYPEPTGDYLQPIFRDLHQEMRVFAPGSEVAWRVFAEAFEADDQTVEQVRKVVAKLDAETFADREAAVAKLNDLGLPAAMVLMEMDRTDLTAEQNTRIDAFLAEFRRLPQDELHHLRTSRHFLLNCLFSDDRRLRRRALEELQRLHGRPIEFDLDLEDEALAEAVANLRAELTEKTTPSPQTG